MSINHRLDAPTGRLPSTTMGLTERTVDLRRRPDIEAVVLHRDGGRREAANELVEIGPDEIVEVLLHQRLDDSDLELLRTGAVHGIALWDRATDRDIEAVCDAAPWLRIVRTNAPKGLTSRSLVAVAGLTDLRHLGLQRVRTSADGIAAIAALPSLHVLWLEQSRLHDEDLAQLCEAPISSLSLDGNIDLTDEGLAPLSRLTELEFLSLKGCRIGDAGMRHLSGLRNLRMVMLPSTLVTEAGIALLPNNPDMFINLPSGLQVEQLGHTMPNILLNGLRPSGSAPRAPVDPTVLPPSMRTATVPVLALFTTPTCRGCPAAKEALSLLPSQTKERVKVVEVDATADPGLASAFSVMSVPTFLLVKDGAEVWRSNGGRSGDALDAELRPVLDEVAPAR